jgi:murein DD-endopeptidase MepM/ murein hydrolase activator NlpD
VSPDRRALLVGAGAALAAGAAKAQGVSPGLDLTGRFVQGGHAIGRTWPRAMVFVDGEALTTASGDGVFVVGFDRDAPGSVRIEVRSGERSIGRTLDIATGHFPSTRIDGLPTATVEPSDPELLARIRREVALKTEGFASRIDADHFKDGFVWPLESYRVTSLWGSQRILNGTPARPHYGIDLAAPRGTAIRAPAAGKVTLAQSGLHFEGGLVLIDHGQGLITAYLHQSRVEVSAGQEVYRGEVLGRVGMTGRATGPHLCWRMKWRDRNLDPSLMVKT